MIVLSQFSPILHHFVTSQLFVMYFDFIQSLRIVNFWPPSIVKVCLSNQHQYLRGKRSVKSFFYPKLKRVLILSRTRSLLLMQMIFLFFNTFSRVIFGEYFGTKCFTVDNEHNLCTHSNTARTVSRVSLGLTLWG